jgi:uncharacterized membrane protein YtjA (UPF0391 family)
MLKWAIAFLIVGVIASLFGFTSIAGVSYAFAKIIAIAAFVVFAALLVAGLVVGRRLTAAGGHR